MFPFLSSLDKEKKKNSAEEVPLRVLHPLSGCYSCIWEPIIKVHPPASLITIKKRESISTDGTGNWRAGVYLCACVSERTSQAVYECFMCVCDGTPTDLTLLSRLTWQRRLHDSHSEDRWQGLTPLRNPPTHTPRRDAPHKTFLGTHWLISQSNNESCLASSPTKCLYLCAWIWLAVCFDKITWSQQVKSQHLLPASVQTRVLCWLQLQTSIPLYYFSIVKTFSHVWQHIKLS